MHFEHPDHHHLLVHVDDDSELVDQRAGATLQVRIRDIDHPETDTTVDAEVVYVDDGDLYVASWYYDGMIRRRVNRDGDPTTQYLKPGDDGYRETSLLPPDANAVWKPNDPRMEQGGARPSERE